MSPQTQRVKCGGRMKKGMDDDDDDNANACTLHQTSNF